MRLTLDTIKRAPQFTNALCQRELDLRGLGITVLEEHALALLNDSFDVLNLSQNPLVRLEYFPGNSGPSAGEVPVKGTTKPVSKMMMRLETLIVHCNRLTHVSEATCAALLPNIRAFVADHNEFKELRDLLFLSQWKKLEIFSIEHNPITASEDNVRLRAFVVFLCPTLKLVNYQRVTQVDRQNTESMRKEFAGLVKEWRQLEAKQLLRHGASNRSDVNGGGVNSTEPIKKIRKRGREAREAAAKSGIRDSAPETVAPRVDAGICPPAGIESGEDEEESKMLQARLEALEEKMTAVETEEELAELQQELMELEAVMRQQEMSKKTKKSRKA